MESFCKNHQLHKRKPDVLERFAVASWDLRSVKKPTIINQQSVNSGRHKNTCASKQPHVRNHGQLGQNREWTSEEPQHDAAAKAGVLWEPVVKQKQLDLIRYQRVNILNLDQKAGGSSTTPTRPHPGLGQAHRTRVNCQSMQRADSRQGRKQLDCLSSFITATFASTSNAQSSRCSECNR